MSDPDDVVFVHGGTLADEAVLTIDSEGRIFWRGREVTGDEEFRKAMIDLRDLLSRHGNA